MSQIASCLARNLRRLRRERQLTQSELAQKAGISLIFLQALEGERKWISPTTVEALANALNVSESELFMDSSAKSRGSSKMKSRISMKVSEVLPEDISQAFFNVCDDPRWNWEMIRWILEGYQRKSLYKSNDRRSGSISRLPEDN